MDKNSVLVSGSVVVRDLRGKEKWFLIKGEEEWEFPKVVVRKGESSVRAALRIMGEKGGMTTRVLEEAGRAGGVTTVGGRTLPQRHIYYLMLTKENPNEAIGFEESMWLDYAHALKKVATKREKGVLKDARGIYKKWKEEREKRRK